MNGESLSQLKKILKDQKIDFFLLPNSDEFFSEYLPESEKRIEYLTGFSGSNATVIFGQEKCFFFTDGRYTLQAKNELDLKEFEIFNIAEKSVLKWIEENLGEKKLALDAKLASLNFVKQLFAIIDAQRPPVSAILGAQRPPVNVILGAQRLGSREDDSESKFTRSSAANATKDDELGGIIFLDQNPVDQIWKNRPSPKNSEIYFCSEKLVGLSSIEKRKIVTKNLEADAMIITKPENLCWLLNIRASDIEFTPLLLAYGILFKNGEVELFVDEKRCNGLEFEKINLMQVDCFDLRVSALKKSLQKIQIDAASTNYWLYQCLEKNNFEIIQKTDPIEIAKACKNEAEIFGAIKSHEADGLAVTKFLFWLDEAQKNGEEIDEISAQEKLLEFRKEDRNFLYPSFASISGFASNGAVIHYRASEKTNKKISCHPKPVEGSLYLIDSGGQYFGENFCGTTDITRTIAIGKPSAEMIENFTRVLKGHIALARVKFPVGTTGAQLDALARFHLWNAGLDYDHGTGHGVGSFLSVHEGPQGISKRAHQPLIPGMILSNEPGFYLNGEYGIRIENLMLVEKFNEKFLHFKTLTLAPIDHNLIDFQMLTRPERKWLCNYHEEILKNFESKLDQENCDGLKKILRVFKGRYA
jgi:Xaa-Pro aminopeptidase